MLLPKVVETHPAIAPFLKQAIEFAKSKTNKEHRYQNTDTNNTSDRNCRSARQSDLKRRKLLELMANYIITLIPTKTAAVTTAVLPPPPPPPPQPPQPPQPTPSQSSGRTTYSVGHIADLESLVATLREERDSERATSDHLRQRLHKARGNPTGDMLRELRAAGENFIYDFNQSRPVSEITTPPAVSVAIPAEHGMMYRCIFTPVPSSKSSSSSASPSRPSSSFDSPKSPSSSAHNLGDDPALQAPINGVAKHVRGDTDVLEQRRKRQKKTKSSVEFQCHVHTLTMVPETSMPSVPLAKFRTESLHVSELSNGVSLYEPEADDWEGTTVDTQSAER